MRPVTRLFTWVAERYLPDAFIFVFALTTLVFLMGIFKGFGPVEIVDFWGAGFFKILTFTAQSTLMLVTGFALAHIPVVHRLLVAFASIPKNEVQVIITTTLVMMICSWLSWGFGLIAGAIVAREMGIVHRGKVHYPLVVAASYSGFIVWHAGYGGAIPALVATPGHFLAEKMGVVPVSETVFAMPTLIILLVLALVVPLTLVFMRPGPAEERVSIPESELAFDKQGLDQDGLLPEAHDKGGSKVLTPAERLENSRIATLVLGLLGTAWLAQYFVGGGAVNLNIVIMSFFTAGLLLAPNVNAYIRYFKGGAASSYGIIMQFPFYAGIMGMMTGTGIAEDIANAFVSFSSAETLPFWTFLSAGIVNMFVPSGGGQWAVQGPIMIDAAQQLGADFPKVVMAIAWGDAWTNMIQPFWALPLLAIAGLGIRDIMGYTAVILIVSGVVIGGSLLII